MLITVNAIVLVHSGRMTYEMKYVLKFWNRYILISFSLLRCAV